MGGGAQDGRREKKKRGRSIQGHSENVVHTCTFYVCTYTILIQHKLYMHCNRCRSNPHRHYHLHSLEPGESLSWRWSNVPSGVQWSTGGRAWRFREG